MKQLFPIAPAILATLALMACDSREVQLKKDVQPSPSPALRDETKKVEGADAIIPVNAQNTSLKNLNASERLNAVTQLTDQALLERILVEDNKDFKGTLLPVQAEALENLTDQFLLARVVLDGKYWVIRESAVNKISDQTILAKLATENKVGIFRKLVVKKLTNQELLFNIVVEDKDKDVQYSAINSLANQSLLAKLSIDKGLDRGLRHMAFSKIMKGTHINLTEFPGKLSLPTDDALEAIARIQLVFANPIISKRMPSITLEASITPEHRIYGGPGSHSYLLGESVKFTISRASEVVITKQWTTHFPEWASTQNAEFLGFNSAQVDISEILAQVFRLGGLSHEDLVSLCASEGPEAQVAAFANFQDQTSLANLALEGKDFRVHLAVAKMLSDQSLLAKVAMDIKLASPARVVAIEKLEERTLLAQIAAENNDLIVRDAAAKRLEQLRAANP